MGEFVLKILSCWSNECYNSFFDSLRFFFQNFCLLNQGYFPIPHLKQDLDFTMTHED